MSITQERRRVNCTGHSEIRIQQIMTLGGQSLITPNSALHRSPLGGGGGGGSISLIIYYIASRVISIIHKYKQLIPHGTNQVHNTTE